MSDPVVPVPAQARQGSPNLMPDLDRYREVCARAAHDPDGFFLAEARARLAWRRPPTQGLAGSFHEIQDGPVSWFADGTLNVTESCVDRHAARDPDGIAIRFEGDEPGTGSTLTWRALHERVCRMANALADLGLRKGERAIIYMGMVPEAAIAMLAVARLGAVHSVVFGGFSADSLRDRVLDCGAELVLTMDEGRRGGRTVPMKATVDAALAGHTPVRHVVVFRHTGGKIGWIDGRDQDWGALEDTASPHHEAVPTAAEDPLFILYTSGSTGKPKGLVHTTAGYLFWATFTLREVFDLRPGDVHGCVADVGWITGHSYIVYGPLSNGVTTLIFESTPLYPDAGRYWDVVERHRLTTFYGAPTALRALAAAGDEHVRRYDRSSLRVLGSVGEPIQPSAWRWYHDVVGEGRCAVVDTWWQTETGGVLIAPIAPATPTRPGSATLPLPGVTPVIVDDQGRRLRGPSEGRLCLESPWPGIARTVWGDHARYVATYFSTYPPYYFTGDGCRRDEDGYHWITGRVDDVINVSGHRMGTAEFEAALTAMEEIAECAVVGYPHDLKGQGVYAYVVLHGSAAATPDLEARMNQACRASIGAHARVDRFQVVPGLPKTRSGKVMRRILRKIAEGDTSQLGDLSTLADPGVVDAIVQGAPPS
jgi:acetyl-CoA synthetase